MPLISSALRQKKRYDILLSNALVRMDHQSCVLRVTAYRGGLYTGHMHESYINYICLVSSTLHNGLYLTFIKVSIVILNNLLATGPLTHKPTSTNDCCRDIVNYS